MNVLVIGGTRGIGRAVVASAHAAGHSMTVMARNASGFAESVSGVRLVVGDAGDAADIDRAVAGQDVVVWTVGVKSTQRPVHLFSRGTQYLIAAMGRHGVRRLLCVTGIGAGDSRGHGGFVYDRLVQPLLLRSTYADKNRQEVLLRASALDWTIVRPGSLQDDPGTGRVDLSTELGRRGPVTRDDVALVLAETLRAPGTIGLTFEVFSGAVPVSEAIRALG